MRKVAILGIMVCALALPRPARAATITFDGVASGTAINTFYQALGVIFTNPATTPGGDIFAVATSLAASAGNVVSVFSSGVPAFDARYGAVEAQFTTAVGQVSIDAAILRLPEGLGTPTNAPKLEIYTAAGFLTTVSWNFALNPQPDAGGFAGYQTLSYVAGTDSITKVRFLSGQPGGSPSNFGMFDNLTFASSTQPPDNGVPEPGSLLLMGTAGIVGFAARMKRRRGQSR